MAKSPSTPPIDKDQITHGLSATATYSDGRIEIMPINIDQLPEEGESIVKKLGGGLVSILQKKTGNKDIDEQRARDAAQKYGLVGKPLATRTLELKTPSSAAAAASEPEAGKPLATNAPISASIEEALSQATEQLLMSQSPLTATSANPEDNTFSFNTEHKTLPMALRLQLPSGTIMEQIVNVILPNINQTSRLCVGEGTIMSITSSSLNVATNREIYVDLPEGSKDAQIYFLAGEKVDLEPAIAISKNQDISAFVERARKAYEELATASASGAAAGSIEVEPQESILLHTTEGLIARLGGDLNQNRSLVQSWIEEVMRTDSVKSFQKLVEAKMELTNPLIFAAAQDAIKITEALLKLGYLPNAEAEVNADGSSPLHIAASGNCTAVAKLLIDAKADLNKLDAKKETPLSCAALNDSLETFMLLLQAGAKDALGRTPLALAASCDSLNIISELLEKGHVINEVDAEGRTAVREATYHGKHESLKLLIDSKADLTRIYNKDGHNALHYAVTCDKLKNNPVDNEKIMKLLCDSISRGEANIRVGNQKSSHTAFDLACGYGNLIAIKYLLPFQLTSTLEYFLAQNIPVSTAQALMQAMKERSASASVKQAKNVSAAKPEEKKQGAKKASELPGPASEAAAEGTVKTKKGWAKHTKKPHSDPKSDQDEKPMEPQVEKGVAAASAAPARPAQDKKLLETQEGAVEFLKNAVKHDDASEIKAALGAFKAKGWGITQGLDEHTIEALKLSREVRKVITKEEQAKAEAIAKKAEEEAEAAPQPAEEAQISPAEQRRIADETRRQKAADEAERKATEKAQKQAKREAEEAAKAQKAAEAKLAKEVEAATKEIGVVRSKANDLLKNAQDATANAAKRASSAKDAPLASEATKQAQDNAIKASEQAAAALKTAEAEHKKVESLLSRAGVENGQGKIEWLNRAKAAVENLTKAKQEAVTAASAAETELRAIGIEAQAQLDAAKPPVVVISSAAARPKKAAQDNAHNKPIIVAKANVAASPATASASAAPESSAQAMPKPTQSQMAWSAFRNPPKPAAAVAPALAPASAPTIWPKPVASEVAAPPPMYSTFSLRQLAAAKERASNPPGGPSLTPAPADPLQAQVSLSPLPEADNESIAGEKPAEPAAPLEPESNPAMAAADQTEAPLEDIIERGKVEGEAKYDEQPHVEADANARAIDDSMPESDYSDIEEGDPLRASKEQIDNLTKNISAEEGEERAVGRYDDFTITIASLQNTLDSSSWKKLMPRLEKALKKINNLFLSKHPTLQEDADGCSEMLQQLKQEPTQHAEAEAASASADNLPVEINEIEPSRDDSAAAAVPAAKTESEKMIERSMEDIKGICKNIKDDEYQTKGEEAYSKLKDALLLLDKDLEPNLFIKLALQLKDLKTEIDGVLKDKYDDWGVWAEEGFNNSWTELTETYPQLMSIEETPSVLTESAFAQAHVHDEMGCLGAPAATDKAGAAAGGEF